MFESSIPQLPLRGEILLVTDELNSPADFLLYRGLASHLKSAKSTKSIVLSVSGGLSKWKAILAKSVCVIPLP